MKIQSSLRSAMSERVIIADGAMGTMLQDANPSLEDFQGHEGWHEPGQHISRDGIGDLGVIGVRRQVARLDHLHPSLAVFNQRLLKRLPGRTPRADEADMTFGFKVVFEDVPPELVGELESLD